MLRPFELLPHALILPLLLCAMNAGADEAVPQPLEPGEGGRITTVEAWREKRRPEVLELFRTHVYGRTPDRSATMTARVTEQSAEALGGSALRRQVTLTLRRGSKDQEIDVLLYLPQAAASTRVPVFVMLNFGGNHTVAADPAIAFPRSRLREQDTSLEDRRGRKAESYPLAELISRGFGFATAYAGDIDFDEDDAFAGDAHALLAEPGEVRAPDAWGTVAAWDCGLSRIMVDLESAEGVDADRVAVLGHSRMGKAALWAGAQDERFSIVISNNSGCTGAALARNRKGETVAKINKQFPHWFCSNYKNYNDREDALPVDQHMLLALIAPRPVYVGSAAEDQWADPEGEFISCVLASPVYELFGNQPFAPRTFPEPGAAIRGGAIGYHLRPGRHFLGADDWAHYLDFAERHWQDKVRPRTGER